MDSPATARTDAQGGLGTAEPNNGANRHHAHRCAHTRPWTRPQRKGGNACAYVVPLRAGGHGAEAVMPRVAPATREEGIPAALAEVVGRTVLACIPAHTMHQVGVSIGRVDGADNGRQ
eukprot:scaffold2729_cov403-Prasinococcus_capsulatus_cf.AAC.12